MIKNLLFDMGGVIFRQNSEEAYRRFRAMGVNTDDYMGEYGQKGFFLDVETGKIDAGEFCRRMAEAAGVLFLGFLNLFPCVTFWQGETSY